MKVPCSSATLVWAATFQTGGAIPHVHLRIETAGVHRASRRKDILFRRQWLRLDSRLADIF